MGSAVAVSDLGVRYRMWRRNRTASLARHGGKWRLWGLRELTFDVEPGESVGVVGSNGAGKSTLLSAIAGILPADEGEIHVQGRAIPLFAGNAGHQTALSGWDNIFLSSVLLGMSRREARALAPEIGEFSGLATFLDVPVRTYSAGMRARLSVAIAVHAQPDVLLIDEALRAGDEEFRRRTRQWLDDFRARGGTTIAVTHDLADLQARADRVLWLHEGHLQLSGPTAEVVDAYRQSINHGS